MNDGLVGDFKIRHTGNGRRMSKHTHASPRLTLSVSLPKPKLLNPQHSTPSSAGNPAFPITTAQHSLHRSGRRLVSLSASISDPHPRRKQLHPLPLPLAACSTTLRSTTGSAKMRYNLKDAIGGGDMAMVLCCMRFSDGARPTIAQARMGIGRLRRRTAARGVDAQFAI